MQPAMNFGLKPGEINAIQNILSEFPVVRQAVIFGSRAKGNHKPNSDIYIALIGDEISLTVLNQISTKLDDLMLPVMFDVTIYKLIHNSDLIQHINRVGKKIYG